MIRMMILAMVRAILVLKNIDVNEVMMIKLMLIRGVELLYENMCKVTAYSLF